MYNKACVRGERTNVYILEMMRYLECDRQKRLTALFLYYAQIICRNKALMQISRHKKEEEKQ